METKRIAQTAELLPSISQRQMLSMFKHVCATPYGNNLYDLPKTKKVIETCVKKSHLSILEHGNITVKCQTNIATYKNYTRHRHCAFTIESTAFNKYKDTIDVITAKELTDVDTRAILHAFKAYCTHDIKIGRDFLPQCCASTMIVTTNIREWRNIIAVRGDPNDNLLTNQLRDLIWIALYKDYPFFFPLEDNKTENPMCIYNTWGSKKEATLTYV
jgi:thymidylate synthase ThyX